MIDYKVRDDWPDDEPTWMKSLVSSLDRRHRLTSSLALPVIVQEVINWVALASGEEAWRKAANRRSLNADIEQSIGTFGSQSKKTLGPAIAEFVAAFSAIDGSAKTVLSQAPGTRTDPLWANLTAAGIALLTELASDASVASCWADLVAVARAGKRQRRDHMWFAELLFEQLRLRSLDPQKVFDDVVRMLAYGRSPDEYLGGGSTLSADERLSAAERLLLQPAVEENVVVWLGYSGGRLDHSVKAGSVTFMQAAWFVPNTRPDGPEFDHKDELSQIVGAGMFRVAELVKDKSEVDVLARVDLGLTPAADAVTRAEKIVNVLLDISIHWSGGVRPLLAQTAIMIDGQVGLQSWHHNRSAPSDDSFGEIMTGDGIRAFTPKLGAALATGSLPMYLAAAVECQTAADLPHSRERMLQRPGEADMRAAVPLQDRVVQHLAAHATITPAQLFDLLLTPWSVARWQSDVELAVRMCLLGGGPKMETIDELRGQFYATSTKYPWLVFVADNETALLDVCRVESERSWISRMLRSVSDPGLYAQLLDEYQQGDRILAERRARTRNALVHGNPVEFQVVESVAQMASYFSRKALHDGLDSFVSGVGVEKILSDEQQASLPLLNGTSVADHWRAKAASLG